MSGRLFSVQSVPLGCEHSLATGPMPCGLNVDMERARFARRGAAERMNSRGEWETDFAPPAEAPLERVLVWEDERWHPALSLASTLAGIGPGKLCRLPGETDRYGREAVLGTRGEEGLTPAPWLRRARPHDPLSGPELQQEILPIFPRFPTAAGWSRSIRAGKSWWPFWLTTGARCRRGPTRTARPYAERRSAPVCRGLAEGARSFRGVRRWRSRSRPRMRGGNLGSSRKTGVPRAAA